MQDPARPPLASLSHEWHFLPQRIVDIAATSPAATAPAAVPDGMVRIPASSFRLQVSGIEIEGGNDIGVDVQYPWEDSPSRHHDHVIEIKPFSIDRYP